MIQHKLIERCWNWEGGQVAIQWDDANSCQWVKDSLEYERGARGKVISTSGVPQGVVDKYPLGITNQYVVHAVKQLALSVRKYEGVKFNPDKTSVDERGMIKVEFELPEDHPKMDEIVALKDALVEVQIMNTTLLFQAEFLLNILDRHAFDFGPIEHLPALDELTDGCLLLPYDKVYMELVNPSGNVICCAAEYFSETSDVWQFIKGMGLDIDHTFAGEPIIMSFWVHFPGREISMFYREMAVVGRSIETGEPETMVIGPYDGDVSRKQTMDSFSQLGKNVITMSRHMLNCLEVLNSKGVSTQRVPAPMKLNKKRRKRGKPQIVDFHTLSLYRVDPKSRTVLGQREPSGEPGSKRGHWRRAHLRTYTDDRYVNMKGKSTLIKQTWIGGGKSKTPDKQYEVKT